MNKKFFKLKRRLSKGNLLFYVSILTIFEINSNKRYNFMNFYHNLKYFEFFRTIYFDFYLKINRMVLYDCYLIGYFNYYLVIFMNGGRTTEKIL